MQATASLPPVPAAVVLFEPSAVRGLHNPAFGAGVFGRREPFSRLDLAWEAGHEAGINDGDPEPPARLPADERLAWRRGFDTGWATFEERIEAAELDILWSHFGELPVD